MNAMLAPPPVLTDTDRRVLRLYVATIAEAFNLGGAVLTLREALPVVLVPDRSALRRLAQGTGRLMLDHAVSGEWETAVTIRLDGRPVEVVWRWDERRAS